MRLRTSERLLLSAAYMGQLDEIKRLVKQQGVNLDVKDEEGCTPLIHAALEGHLDVVRYLVEAKANLEAKHELKEHEHWEDQLGDTVLILAAEIGELNVVQYLVKEARANLETRNTEGYTALIVAAEKGRLDVVQCLLEARANLEARTEKGEQTALTRAAVCARLDVVQHLVKEPHPALDTRDANGHTPLTVAAGIGDLDIVRCLLQAKANLEAEDGHNALSIAASYPHAINVTRYLVKEAHANVETNDSAGCTPLMFAAQKGNLIAVRFLLEAKANLEAEDGQGNTALHYCSYEKTGFCFDGKSSTNVVRCLLEAKANLEGRNDDGETLLHISVSRRNFGMVRYLLEETRVNLEARDKYGYTPLLNATDVMNATVDRPPEILENLKYLVEAKANIEAIDNAKMTVLNLVTWEATARELEDVVQYLVNEARANVETKDCAGMTPLMHASKRCGIGVVRCLLDAKADPEAKSNNSMTARDFAIITDQEVAELLLEVNQPVRLILN